MAAVYSSRNFCRYLVPFPISVSVREYNGRVFENFRAYENRSEIVKIGSHDFTYAHAFNRVPDDVRKFPSIRGDYGKFDFSGFRSRYTKT